MPRSEIPGGPVFWTGVLVGWTVILAGVVGALVDARLTHPRSMAIWLIGCLVAHDFVLAPVVFMIGKATRRVASGAGRGLVHATLFLYGVLFLVSIPVLGRFGQRPDNDTLLPRDYSVGLFVALAVVWITTTIVFVSVWWRRRT